MAKKFSFIPHIYSLGHAHGWNKFFEVLDSTYMKLSMFFFGKEVYKQGSQ